MLDKPKKLLITILTHHNLPALKRMVRSVEDQEAEENLSVEVIIVVNTINDDYWREIQNSELVLGQALSKLSYKIIRTESNGKPGKGKNSCRALFLESDCDFLSQVDGDDFLYPTFVRSIWEHIEWHPTIDVLGKHPMDAISPNQLGGHHYKVGPKGEWWACVWGGSLFKRADHGPGKANWVEDSHPSSWDRILLQSRLSAVVKMDEDLPNGEDHLYSMQLLVLHQQRKLRYFGTMSSDLYVTDRTQNNTIQNDFPFHKHVAEMKRKMLEVINPERSSQEELPMIFKDLLIWPDAKARVINILLNL